MAELLEAVVDRLIPGDDYWPAAGRTGAAVSIERAGPAGLAALVDAIGAAAAVRGARFEELDGAAQDAVLRDVEAVPALAGVFRAVYELACETYYSHPLVTGVVRERTGFDEALPLRGVPLEPFDERLLDRVRSLPPSYRRVGP